MDSCAEWHEVYKTYNRIASRNKKAGKEISFITNCLDGFCYWGYGNICISHCEGSEDFLITYEDLEPETIEFVKKYIKEAELIKVENVAKHFEGRIKFRFGKEV